MSQEKSLSPITQELTGVFSDTIGSMPNPDVIMRKAGISVDVYAEMLYDPQIFSAYQKRKRKIQQLKYNIEGEDETINEFVALILSDLNMSNIITGMTKSLPYGFSVAEIIWEQIESQWLPIQVKNRSNNKFDFNDLSELQYETQEGFEVAPYGKFILHRNDFDDEGNPYGTSLNSRCYWYWRFKKHGWRVWGLYLEKYGDPALVLKSPETDEKKIQSLLESLDGVSSGSNIVVGTEEELKTVTAPSSGSIGYADFTKEADKQIAKIYLGSSMLMDESQNGTYGTAVEHGSDLQDMIMTDAESIANSLRFTLIEPLVRFNFGEEAEVPYLRFFTDILVDDETQTDVEDEAGEAGESGDKPDEKKKEEKPDEKKKEEKPDKKKKEETKAQAQKEADYFFLDELTIEQFADLPKYKQTLETLSANLHKSQLPTFKKIVELKPYSEDPKKALFELEDFYIDSTEKLSVNIGYSLFFVKMYAKYTAPDYKESFKSKVSSMFEPFKIEDGIVQPYEETRKSFKSKVPISDDEFRKLKEEARYEAFAMAGVKNQQALNALKDSLENAIIDGTDERLWKKEAGALLSKYGFNPKPSHLGNVYRTNLYTAYSKAGYKEYKEVEEEFPALMYDAIGDSRTRPTHNALSGKIFFSSDPIWDTIYPPNGYNCRCSVIPMSKKKLVKRQVDDGADYSGEKYAPDEGWRYHSGRDYKPEVPVPYGKDSVNDYGYEAFNLPKLLEPSLRGDFKAITEEDISATILGVDVKLPDNIENRELVENVLSTPNEVWMFSRFTKSDNLVYTLKYVKSFVSDNGVESYTILVDSRGNFMELRKFRKSDRKGYPIYANKGE